MTELFNNRLIIAAFFGWIIAQALKVVTDLYEEKKLNFRRFVEAGGMPSSHSSMVIALTTSIAKFQGMGSYAFAISAVLSVIVMYDAAGVRRETGTQSKMLNWMAENWPHKDKIGFEKKLKEFVGHTPLEVLAGAMLGLIIGLIV